MSVRRNLRVLVHLADERPDAASANSRTTVAKQALVLGQTCERGGRESTGGVGMKPNGIIRKMAVRRLAWVALVVVAGFGAAAGQPAARSQQGQTPPPQTPPPATQNQQPQTPQTPQATFRTRVDSVSVDVSVTDKQGKPVTDLKTEDFEVRESKAPQQIEQFKLIGIPDAFDTAPAPEVLSLAAMEREVKRDDTRMIVFLLDDYHVRRINSMRLREQLARFASELTAHDLVALMYPLTTPEGLTFTYDRDGMANEISHFEGRKVRLHAAQCLRRTVADAAARPAGAGTQPDRHLGAGSPL